MSDLTWWHWTILILVILIFLLLLILVIMLCYATFSLLDHVTRLVSWIRYIIGRIISDITFVENVVKQTIDEFNHNASQLQSQVKEALHIQPPLQMSIQEM